MIPATLIMLNWKRSQQLEYLISKYITAAVFDEIIVWNNSPDIQLKLDKRVICITPSQDLGMNTRWYAGSVASNKCVFYIDDDLYVENENLEQLYQSWLSNQAIIHGFFGRNPRKDNTYAEFIDCKDAVVDMIIGKLIVTSRDNILYMLKTIRNYNITKFNDKNHGEDIFFSYVVINQTQQKNRVYKPIKKITQYPEDKFAICNRKNHMLERNQVMQSCIKQLLPL
jgi:hypothetical protein